MKKMRLIFTAMAVLAVTFLYACGQSQPPKEEEEKTGVEEMEQNTEEKTQEMIREAEEMEGDTTSG